MAVSISKILKDTELSLKQFTQEQIKNLEKRIEEKDLGEGVKPYAKCIIRDKEILIKPEEIIRQLFAEKLMNEFGYPKENITFELPVKSVGRDKENVDFADIVVFTDSTKTQAYIIFEIKRPDEKDVDQQKKQLESYCRVEGASLGSLINGDDIEKYYINNLDENSKTRGLQEISVLPKFGENLSDVLKGERQTLKYLIKHDRLRTETLKKIISDLEQRFSANDSSDKSFDEILKLVYCKLYDESSHNDDADYISRDIKRQQKINSEIGYYEALENIDDDDFTLLEFRAKNDEDETEVFKRIEKLFDDAQKNWKGAFAPNTKLDMQPSTVKSCVLEFQNVKLFNSNLEVVDEAFEYLVNKNQKGEMGQYFTPRYVIDMCVRMLNPKKEETMIDTASGSCGFPMHTILHVWNKRDNLTTAKREQWEKDYVRDKVFAIDFSEKAVRVGKILNIITGDGHTNVLYLNTPDYDRWETQFKKNPDWWAKYNEGFTRLEGLRENPNSYEKFNFDILMANPPFAGDLDDKKILGRYELSKNAKGEIQNKVGRDVLFIERNLNFLKPGGRMAIVLPQGRFNNSSDKYIRDYIAERCRILAVVGLHGNAFKPHTGTKTSVLFVQKWDEKLCPKKDDYDIFFATMQEPSKDNSGDKIYVTERFFDVTTYSYHTLEKFYFEKKEVTKEEYDELVKDKANKKNCKSKIETVCHSDSKKYREDEFENAFGSTDSNSHKKWIQKAVKFALKTPKKGEEIDATLKAEISIEDFLKLDDEKKAKYKEELILGKNANDSIDFETYNSLSNEEKKFYVPSIGISDYTERVKDSHGHIFVKHDLFNHDPKLEPKGRYCADGIAEAFAEFAKKEGLSFF